MRAKPKRRDKAAGEAMRDERASSSMDGGYHLHSDEGWPDLAVVTDLYMRMIVGWSMAGWMTRELVMNAWRMARFRRKPALGRLPHSDRGRQYFSGD